MRGILQKILYRDDYSGYLNRRCDNRLIRQFYYGANRINPSNYSGLNIYLTVNKDYFEIKDNCGGFSIDTAKRYAFRFGRPEDAPKGNGTVGRFGIGMKRSLFKIGKNFIVESQSKQDAFKVEVDVDDWSKKVRTIKMKMEHQI